MRTPIGDSTRSVQGRPSCIRRAFAFQRDVIAIYASRSSGDRKAALDAAVQRYQRGPGLAVADAAKDMSILYDHPYTSFVPPVPPEAEPHRELAYPSLTGAMWAARWYGLAVLTPLEDFPAGPERDRALETVEGRLRAKLSLGGLPEAPPTELPLAPAIAPGLVALHDRAASIIDNLHMMLDVIADVLVHPTVPDRRAAVATVIEQFSTRQYRCVQVDEWIVVALRHSIFAQGGPALAVMTARERNAFSGVHGQHYGPRRLPPPCDPRLERAGRPTSPSPTRVLRDRRFDEGLERARIHLIAFVDVDGPAGVAFQARIEEARGVGEAGAPMKVSFTTFA